MSDFREYINELMNNEKIKEGDKEIKEVLDEIIRDPSSYHIKTNDFATLEVYYALPEERRVELIDGKIYDMAAPSANHQIILSELSYEIKSYLKRKDSQCRMFFAPYDVCLDNDDYTMVQPDIMIICDREKYENGIRCNGAPDFIVEIVSKSNSNNDYFLKLQKYQNAGVKEYWIVDPIKMRIIAFYFEEDVIPKMYTFDDKVTSRMNPDLEIDFASIKELLLGEE